MLQPRVLSPGPVVEGVARLKQRSLVKITIAHVVVGVIKELTGAIRRSCSEAKRRVSF